MSRGNLDYFVEYETISNELELMNDNKTSWSKSTVKIRLFRKKWKYIIENMIPCGIFVVVSWVSFLIPPEVIPGRLALLVTLFLVIVNVIVANQSSVPNSEGLTVMMGWTFACLVFIINALAGYAFILFLDFKEKDIAASRAEAHGLRKRNIDKAFLVIFPTVFIIFNLAFWPIATTASSGKSTQ